MPSLNDLIANPQIRYYGKVTILVCTALLCTATYGQTTTTELYHSKDYQALVKLESTADALSGEELYMVGYAFFQLENDDRAVEFYDKAIAKGFDNGPTFTNRYHSPTSKDMTGQLGKYV